MAATEEQTTLYANGATLTGVPAHLGFWGSVFSKLSGISLSEISLGLHMTLH